MDYGKRRAINILASVVIVIRVIPNDYWFLFANPATTDRKHFGTGYLK